MNRPSRRLELRRRRGLRSVSEMQTIAGNFFEPSRVRRGLQSNSAPPANTYSACAQPTSTQSKLEFRTGRLPRLVGAVSRGTAPTAER